jgi:hypothetical protein
MSFGFASTLTKPQTPLSAALDLAFAGATSLDERITFTRADSTACATFFGPDGLLEVAGINLITNSVLAGGTSGVGGSGATSPTGWGGTFTNTTLTYSDMSVRVQTATSRGILTQTPTLGLGAYVWSVQIVAIGTSATVGDVIGLVVGTGTFTGSGYLVNGAAANLSTVLTAPCRVSVYLTMTVAGTVTFRIGAGVSSNTTQDVTVSQPQLEVGSTFTSYAPTTTVSTSGPRFDYDPTSPAGVTGSNLWTYGTGPTLSVGAFGLMIGSYSAPQIQVGKTYEWTASCTTTATGAQLSVGGSVVKGSTWSAGVTYTGTIRATASALVIQESGTPGANAGKYFDITVQEVTFTPKGFLVEESRVNNETNGVAYNEGVIGDTQTQNAVAPDGTTTAYTILADGTSGQHYVFQGTATPTALNTYTVSVFLKAGTGSLVQLYCASAHSGATVYCNYNLSTGAMTAGAGIVASSNFCTSVGGGWYRCGFSYVASATAAGALVVTTPITSISDTRAPTNSANTSYLRWGGQFESTAAMGSATFATSFIYTTTTAVTRAADTANMTGTNFSSWYNQTEGTFVVEGDSINPSGACILTTRAGSGVNDVMDINVNANGTAVYRVINANVTTATATTSTTTSTGIGKAAFAYIVNNTNIAANGNLQIADTSTAIPVADNMMIGCSRIVATGVSSGHIRRIQYYNTRLPETTLTALST